MYSLPYSGIQQQQPKLPILRLKKTGGPGGEEDSFEKQVRDLSSGYGGLGCNLPESNFINTCYIEFLSKIKLKCAKYLGLPSLVT